MLCNIPAFLLVYFGGNLGTLSSYLTSGLLLLFFILSKPFQKPALPFLFCAILYFTISSLNYHGDDDSYYEEWLDEIKEYDGWIININLLEHVKEEMQGYNLHYYIDMSDDFNEIEWRLMKPNHLFKIIDGYFIEKIKRLNA